MIVRLMGGLGNQMFCYAFAKSLSLLKNTQIFLDYRDQDLKRTAPKRRFEIDRFNLTMPIVYDFKIPKNQWARIINNFLPKKYRLQKYKFPIYRDANLTPEYVINNNFEANAYFLGYFQNIKYFIDIEQILKNDFTLKTPLSQNNQKLQNHILSTKNSCFLHVRRGDYLGDTGFINLCETNYYNKALKIIKDKLIKPHIFIFSNDIQWCKNHFLQTLEPKITNGIFFDFIEGNGEGDAVEEMELMRSCKHAIKSNSTFSWWAAFLLNNKERIVIGPKEFFTKHVPDVDPNNLIIKDWIILDFPFI